MFAVQGTAQHLESVRVGALLAAAALVVFWRTVIRLVLMGLAVLVIALLGFGAFVLFASMHG